MFKHKGFTLIELLVVIAIIAILAAILFPVFTRARQMAYQTKCCAHGKQLALAMTSYMDDNNGRFPTNATSEMLEKFRNVTWKYTFPGR
jgi:prepilin-type N-terminal cleavage/methylation domain-containing protein